MECISKASKKKTKKRAIQLDRTLLLCCMILFFHALFAMISFSASPKYRIPVRICSSFMVE